MANDSVVLDFVKLPIDTMPEVPLRRPRSGVVRLAKDQAYFAVLESQVSLLVSTLCLGQVGNVALGVSRIAQPKKVPVGQIANCGNSLFTF